MRSTWKKVLSTALSLSLCGCAMLPAMSSTVSAATKIKIACVGDSITAGSHASGAAFYYPTQLQQLLGDGYEVKNFGVSGCTLMNSGDQPYQQDTHYKESQSFAPDYVILMLGTNDAKTSNWTHKADFETDMKAMIQSYQSLASHPTVVVATSPTVGATNIGISDAVVTGEVVPLQKKVAAEMGCPVIDINALTKNAPQNYADGIHPNDAGYTAMAKMMYEGLQGVWSAAITRFVVKGAVGTIDDTASTITVLVPADTALTALTPDITVANGAKLDKSGAQNFTKPVTYTITGANGSTRAYTVTVNQLPRVKVACVGDSLTAQEVYPKQLEEFLGDGYEVGHFGVNSTTAQKDGLKENGDNPASGAYINHPQYQQSLDFKPDIVLLTLGSNDSKQGVGSQSGHKLVTNWKADSPQNYERDLKELIASYQAIGATVIFGTSPSGYLTAGNWGAKPDIVNNQIAPIQRKVAAEMGCFLTDFNKLTQGKETALIGGDGLHPNFNGYYLLANQHYINIQNVQAAITGFAVNDQTGRISQIDKEIHTIVPDGTDLTALTPTVTLAEGAQCDRAGKQNFGQPLPYTVTSAGGWVSTYTVTVTSPSGVTLSKMQTLPDKTTYLLGDRLDTTGATILATYTDGTQKVVPVTSDMVSGYDWLKAAKQTLTVSYEGKTTTFTVQVNPYGLLGTFSAMSGKFRVLKNGDGLLYADWKWADQNPIDLSGYGDRSTLSLELDIAFGSDNEAIDTTAMWSQLVIKLRSAELNGENNCGWNLFSSNMDPTIISGDKQKLHVSIPLNKTPTNKTGNMDWATTGRIIIQGFMFDNYKTNSIDHYMDIANVYIVDNSQKPDTSNVDLAELNAAIAATDTVDELSMYTPETVKAFEQALALAKAYLNNPYATQEAVNTAASELTAAQQALAAKTILSGDVDENSRIDAVDALLTLQTAAEKVTLTKAQTIAADVDGTAGITAADALLILKHATGQTTAFPGDRA